MTKTPNRDSIELEPGWNALAEGRWAAARTSFEAALAEQETPAALEGLSWAAWWLDDADAVFGAREDAYRLYRKSGDVPGAARMATWLAVDHLDFHGAWSVAKGWLRRAHRLLDPLEPGAEHGWLAFQDGYLAHASGDTQRARECAALAVALGRRFSVADLEMLGLALEGSALVACAEVEEGMRYLDEATAAALEGEAAIPISSAWSCCFLVSACTTVLDFERAFEWCDRIAEFAERYGSRYMLAFCRAEYGAVHLWRGEWSKAEAELAAAVDDYSRSRPAWATSSRVALAELRRRQGKPDESVLLLDQAGASSGAQLCRASLALDEGEPLRAVELGERLLRQMPTHRRLDRFPALELLVRARVARGELDEAASSLEAMRQIAGRVGTAAIRACTDLAGGMIAASRGDHEGARKSLEDAVDRFERCGAPFHAALARIELATSLLALGRADAAEREAATALASLLELGAAREAERARRLLEACTADGPGGLTLPQITVREREGPARGGAHEPADRRPARGERAHRAPPRHEHPPQAGRPLADRRGGAGGARRAARDVARPGDTRRARDGRFGRRRPCPTGSTVVSMGTRSVARGLLGAAALSRIEEIGVQMTAHDASTEELARAGKAVARAMWALGDYHRFAKQTVWELGPVLVSACGISTDQRVLDVAAGTGNVAIRAAEVGARVVASDLTPGNFEAGRREARSRGVELEWVEADAEALPFDEGEFDVVTSSFGAMFAPDHQLVADELVRVCRPGGTIGMINFTPEGLGGEFFELFARYAPAPPPGALAPTLWGSEEHVAQLFGERVESLDMSRSKYVERAASPREYAELFEQAFGPTVGLRASLAAQPGRAAAFDRDFLEFATRTNLCAAGDAAEYHYEYLLVVARKRSARRAAAHS